MEEKISKFLDWVLFALLIFLLPPAYYYLWRFFKAYWREFLIVLVVYVLVDLFILSPLREAKNKRNRRNGWRG